MGNGMTKESVLKTVKDQDIKFVRFWFTDVLGFLKSFAVTPDELELAFDEGMGFDGSSIEGFTRIQESDMVALPDPSTFAILPWRKASGGTARMFCDILTPDGSPFPGDPRYALKRLVKKASDMGLTMYTGPELEFFYFEDSNGTKVLDHGGYFDLTPLDVASDLRRDTITALQDLGIEVEYSHHEVAPSQHEIDLRYTDALTMADQVMTYRLTVKEIAQANGVYATFMPKPIYGENGSGMHTHQSLFKGDKNAFFDGADEYHLSPTGKSYIAGLLEALPGVLPGHQPVGELLQASGSGIRGAHLLLLGTAEPLRDGAGAHVQAGQGEGHARRDAESRPCRQPLSGIRRHARRRSQRHARRTTS